MCVDMVIIYKKTLDKKSADDVTSKSTSCLGPIPAQTMSQGTALFSCGLMEASRWRDVSHSCSSVRPRPVGTSLDSLWDGLPEVSPGHSGSISNLLQDLSLTEPYSTAPPSKRQCRSLSCSDDLGRSTWRPQGSRVWTAVEKRRCHSGGSVQRTSTSAFSFPSMQRSSSFSLAFPGTSCPPPAQQPLYLSPHEQMPSPPSSPDSTPEMERRCGQSTTGLSRSRSQPCVLNDKKIGVKRRRPDDTNKQRPSLDLAKMTQKLRSFHSLSCPGITAEDHSEPDQTPAFNLRNTVHFENGLSNKLCTDKSDSGTKDSRGNPALCPTIEDADWTSSDCGDVTTVVSTNQKEGEALWAGRCSMYQLGGELDIEQIERN